MALLGEGILQRIRTPPPSYPNFLKSADSEVRPGPHRCVDFGASPGREKHKREINFRPFPDFLVHFQSASPSRTESGRIWFRSPCRAHQPASGMHSTLRAELVSLLLLVSLAPVPSHADHPTLRGLRGILDERAAQQRKAPPPPLRGGGSAPATNSARGTGARYFDSTAGQFSHDIGTGDYGDEKWTRANVNLDNLGSPDPSLIVTARRTVRAELIITSFWCRARDACA